MNTRLKALKCYVWPTLLYGEETWWTVTNSLLFRLDGFDMWIYRRVLEISWSDKIANEEGIQKDWNWQRNGAGIYDEEVAVPRT